MNPDLDRQPRQASGRWPFPGDTPLVRARKVAQMYRARLRALSTDACDDADNAAVGFGETWVVPRVLTVNEDDWLSPADAADYLCVGIARIRGLRLSDRLPGRKVDGEWQYRVADLLALQAATRRRAPRLVAES